ncbi:hypothetical protein BGW80DRAFT_1297247 [Lactifluus volemus]|nr:hypothetical protein BGW80DRAFT_1297247 [Lactifluus volemus]
MSFHIPVPSSITHHPSQHQGPLNHFQKETDGSKTLLDTINSLIAVGAFIAGVQAQVVFGIAVRWFSFVGLTLDLIGTSTGVARALLLQHAIRKAHSLSAQLTAQIDGARHDLRELQHRTATGDQSTDDPRTYSSLMNTVRAISSVIALLAEDRARFGADRKQGGGERAKAAAAAAAADVEELERAATMAINALDPSPVHRIPPIRMMLRGVQGPGYVPVISLIGGALCLIASVLLLAGASQPRYIWISCTSITAAMFAFTMIPPGITHKRKRTALFNRVEETLRQCPPVRPPVFSAPQNLKQGPP